MSSQVDSNRYSVSVLNAATLNEVIQLPAPDFVKAMSVSRDGQWFAAYQNDGEVRVWRTDDWKLAVTVPSRAGAGIHFGAV
ncbi:MAG: hypothetical protein DME23_26605, partial [Verrucomicrobia bacterium]